MQRISLVNLAHNLIRDTLNPGDIAIDATVGNGCDTLFLVEQIMPSGRVYGFDIQQAALDATRVKFRNVSLSSECLTLFHESHTAMAEKIPVQHHGRISACMFNLGYLPGSDKSIITETESTLTALTIAGRLISNRGIITVLAYPGHRGGVQETEQVSRWCEQLAGDRFKVNAIYSAEGKASAPRLFVIRKQG